MAGQRVIYSYPGLGVPTALLQVITAGQAAGVMFFGDNISATPAPAPLSRSWRGPGSKAAAGSATRA
jgi:beta-N-acetylhexosaminidase